MKKSIALLAFAFAALLGQSNAQAACREYAYGTSFVGLPFTAAGYFGPLGFTCSRSAFSDGPSYSYVDCVCNIENDSFLIRRSDYSSKTDFTYAKTHYGANGYTCDYYNPSGVYSWDPLDAYYICHR